MTSQPVTFADDVINQPARVQFDVFLDEHGAALNDCLNGLTEEQARRRLVPSRTTLLRLVKHATFVEKVWFDEAITCRPRAEIGIPASPDESFILDDGATIALCLHDHTSAPRCQPTSPAAASWQAPPPSPASPWPPSPPRSAALLQRRLPKSLPVPTTTAAPSRILP